MMIAFKSSPREIIGMVRHAPGPNILTDDKSNLDWLIYRYASKLK
jgi:hypothetical protein